MSKMLRVCVSIVRETTCNSKLLFLLNQLHRISSLEFTCYYTAALSLIANLPYSPPVNTDIDEPHREKTGLLPMRKQRRRSASR